MDDEARLQGAYAGTAVLMPMLRLQGLTLAALIERKVLTRIEAKALVQEAADFIPKLRVSDDLKQSISTLFAALKEEL